MKDKTLVIVGAQHGDERVGLEVIRRLGRQVDGQKVVGLVANPKALKKGVRFIDQDLNRSFPGRKDGNSEERLAASLASKLRRADYVLDLHSFSCRSRPFAILTKRTAEHFRLVRAMGIERLVLMSPQVASGRSLIDYCRYGVSVEAGRHNLEGTHQRATGYARAILEFLEGRDQRRKKKLDCFEVRGVFYKERGEELFAEVDNFRLVAKGARLARRKKRVRRAPFAFYPILARERAYKKILCLAAKRVKI
jgi:succinylglutamate desuccinylase